MVNLLDYTCSRGEFNGLPSLTQPDMAHSIDYYVNRFRSGLPISGRDVLYDDDLGFDGSLIDNPESDDLGYRSQVSSAVKQFISSRDDSAAGDDGSDDSASGSSVPVSPAAEPDLDEVSNNTP